MSKIRGGRHKNSHVQRYGMRDTAIPSSSSRKNPASPTPVFRWQGETSATAAAAMVAMNKPSVTVTTTKTITPAEAQRLFRQNLHDLSLQCMEESKQPDIPRRINSNVELVSTISAMSDFDEDRIMDLGLDRRRHVEEKVDDNHTLEEEEEEDDESVYTARFWVKAFSACSAQTILTEPPTCHCAPNNRHRDQHELDLDATSILQQTDKGRTSASGSSGHRRRRAKKEETKESAVGDSPKHRPVPTAVTTFQEQKRKQVVAELDDSTSIPKEIYPDDGPLFVHGGSPLRGKITHDFVDFHDRDNSTISTQLSYQLSGRYFG